MEEELDRLEAAAIKAIQDAHHESLRSIRAQYLGRNGQLTRLTKNLAKIPQAQRRKKGIALNKTKQAILAALKQRQLHAPRTSHAIDITIPPRETSVGHLHPLTHIMSEAKQIFLSLGFVAVDGPEIELDEYNFQKLRLHKDHPARDAQDTYYLSEEVLLRTHTSNMQIRYMETHIPPLRAIFPGRVYRRDQIDATHLPSFFQLEGLLVDKETTMSDLLGVLHYFVERMFGRGRKLRIYPHYFPYTEPSIEIEMQHDDGSWMEILGAGMVHPEVLANVKIDPKVFRGWAFGMGPERLAMLKWAIPDIRLFYSGDLRFLRQFP